MNDLSRLTAIPFLTERFSNVKAHNIYKYKSIDRKSLKKLKVVRSKVKVSVFRFYCTCYLKLCHIDKSQRHQLPSTRLSKVSSSNPAVS
jgi:hypothetical protein